MTWQPDYIDVDELKRFLRISDMLDDAELAVLVTAASRAIDEHCNRQFGLEDAPVERLYTASYDYSRGLWFVDIADLMTVTGLAVEIDGTPIGEYSLEPVNAAADLKPWTRLFFTGGTWAAPVTADDAVSITARWGWSYVPYQVMAATRLQASRFASRRDSPYGIAGSPSQGSEMRLLSRVDPDVAVLLRGLSRRRKVA